MRVLAPVCVAISLVLLLVGCGEDTNQNITVVNAKDGLDLRLLPDLVGKAKSAEELEKLLNEPGQKVNNLDLDEDGKVDYIKVTEFGDKDKGSDGKKKNGFSLTVDIGGQEQEVAVIEILLENDKATVQAHGNQHIYGHGHHYHRSYGSGSFFMWGYLMGSHRPYYSSWGRGSYPTYYAPQATRPVDGYRAHANSVASKAGVQQSSGAVFAGQPSPNANKTSSYVKAPLASPTSAQKSYQSSNPSKYSSSRSGRSSYSSGRSGGSSGGK